ncbi:MAG: hypothetical protein EHM78_02075 [Myxococcaceae bacterium]|nr:MAG: hypothetical protein EHM78_02075 [Myxococcaceae bacterium]
MVDTAYSNPGGAGDRTADITVTSNMFAGDPNDLVNGDTTANPGLAMTPGQGDGYIKFDFGSGADPVIDAFRYYIRTHVHSMTMGVWLFEGSDDDATYVNLASGLWLFTAGEEYAVACIEIAGFQSTVGYRYFRMTQGKSVVPPSVPELIEFEFKINSSETTPDPPPDPPPAPDYGEPGGTGDRTGTIWVSQNFSDLSGNAAKLIDGSFTNDATGSFKFDEALNQTSASIVFDFRPSGFKQRIVGFKWYQESVEALGVWTFEASDAPQTGYVPLMTGIALGEDVDAEYTFTNPNGYKYYRLRKTDPDVILTDDAWIEEIEFIIGATDAVPDPLPAYITVDRTGAISVTAVDADFTINPSEAAADGSWFDGDTGDDVAWLTIGTSGGLVFHFIRAQVINEMKWVQSGSSAQGLWRAYGSNDGSSYEAIGREPVRIGGSDIGNTTTYNGFNANDKAFLHYKLELQAGSSSVSHFVREVQFRTLEANLDPGDICLSYANALGSGDRTGDIVVSLDAGTEDTGSDLDCIVDGVRTGFSPFALLVDSNWAIKFDFGSLRMVRQAAIYWQTGNADTNQTAVWEGSNDGSTWTICSVPTNLANEIVNNGSYFRTVATLEDNDQFFRYYRMRRVSGSGALKIQEVEFWIDGGSAGNPCGTYKYVQSLGNRDNDGPYGIGMSLTGTLDSGAIHELVDGVTASGIVITTAQTGVVIKFDFRQKVFIETTKMNGFTPGTDFHGQHYFEGSNDDFVSDVHVLTDPWHAGTGFAFTSEQNVDAPGSYRWYRIRQKSTPGWLNSIGINEFDFRMFPQLSSGACAGDPPAVVSLEAHFVDESIFDIDGGPPGPAALEAHFVDEGVLSVEITDTNPCNLRIGDRTGRIAVTTDLATFEGTASNIVDGAFNWFSSGVTDALGIDMNADVTGLYIKFALDVPAKITGVRVVQSSADQLGTYQFQGSADGSSWTAIGSPLLIDQIDQLLDFSVNSTAYSWYRFLGTSGFAMGFQYLVEVEFVMASCPVELSSHFVDESILEAAPSVALHLAAHFVDEGRLRAREAHEPVTRVQVSPIPSGR